MATMEGDGEEDCEADVLSTSSCKKSFAKDDQDNSSFRHTNDEKHEKSSITLPQFKTKRNIHPSHLNSYQIYNLFNPTKGMRDDMARKGITPRDHHKENIAAIALKSAKFHASKEGIPQLLNNVEGSSTNDKAKQQKSVMTNFRNCLQQISKLSAQVRYEEHVQCKDLETPDNLSTTTESTSTLAKSKKSIEKIDYLTKNILDLAYVAEVGRKKRDFKGPEVHANENYGKVPAYLLRRKIEMLETRDRRVQEQREKHLPPGLVLMKDEERLEVLKTLEDNKENLVAKLRCMPLVVETPSQIKAKGDADLQLKEVEDSIRRFSRPKVYVRYNS